MKYSVCYLLSSSLIPELCSYISTCSSCHMHTALLSISAVWTLPDKLTCFVFYNLYLAAISALFTHVAFCVNLSIKDCIVHMLDNCDNCRNVILKIWNLNITYSSTRRKLLK